MPVMRLQRALARAGVASRRKAEELIQAGRISVNGSAATLGQSVDPDSDVIEMDGRRVGSATPEEHTWLVLNKPAGVLTSATPQRGRKTVFDLIPPAARAPGLTYVGRLDYLTEGLLLLTTDGEAVHRLTHPKSGIERVYLVDVSGDGRAAAAAMRRGVEIDEIGFTRVRDVRAEHRSRGRWTLEITVAEGKNREIRRLCEAVGLEIERLVRTRFGPATLGKLAPGQFRKLTRAEQDSLVLPGQGERGSGKGARGK